MKQHIIIQSVGGNGIIDIVVFVGIPVFCQFFGAEDKYGFVPVFIIFNNGKGGKSFAQTNAVSQDTAVVLLQLVDNGKNSIPLKIIKHTPDLALLESGCLIGQDILRNIVQKFAENMV